MSAVEWTGPNKDVSDVSIPVSNTLLRSEYPFKVIPGTRHASLVYYFPVSLQHQGLFECTMAVALGLYESRRNTPPFKPSAAVFAQRAKAMRAVQHLLTMPDALEDEKILSGIVQLMAAHASSGSNYEE